MFLMNMQPEYSLPLGPEFQWHVNLFELYDDQKASLQSLNINPIVRNIALLFEEVVLYLRMSVFYF